MILLKLTTELGVTINVFRKLIPLRIINSLIPSSSKESKHKSLKTSYRIVIVIMTRPMKAQRSPKRKQVSNETSQGQQMAAFIEALIEWFQENGRDLPW